jgi:hypothetical protein
MAKHRFRLVVMGDSYVSKSAIVKRFLTGNFITKYVATVEDLYNRDFKVLGYLGLPWTTMDYLGLPWATLGYLLASFGLPFGVLWAAFWRPWTCLGVLRRALAYLGVLGRA